MAITFVIVVEKFCFHMLFGISLYQSPRVQVVLHSLLHFDSIISFSTKKKKSCLIKLKFPFGCGKVAPVVKQLFNILTDHTTAVVKSMGQKMFLLFINASPKKPTEKDKKKQKKNH